MTYFIIDSIFIVKLIVIKDLLKLIFLRSFRGIMKGHFQNAIRREMLNIVYSCIMQLLRQFRWNFVK